MTNKEKINELIGVFTNAKSSDTSLYATLYNGLESINALDLDYLDNFDKLKGSTYQEKLSHINEFTFKNCCTVMTALLRGERFVEGVFFEAVESGEILRLLQRAYSVL